MAISVSKIWPQLTKEYVEAGRTVKDIASAAGCHHATVARAMRRYGIATRNKGGRR